VKQGIQSLKRIKKSLVLIIGKETPIIKPPEGNLTRITVNIYIKSIEKNVLPKAY